jgi:hypothetical protein
MKVGLKDGLLAVVLSKPEQKKLRDAAVICEVMGKLSPIPEVVTEAATTARESLTALLGACVIDKAEKADEPAPPQPDSKEIF